MAAGFVARGCNMTNQVLRPIYLDSSALAEEREEVVMPTFTFAPLMGRSPLDVLETDMVLMTKLYRMDVPASMHVRNPDVAEMLKDSLREQFAGKKGTSQLLEAPLPNSRGQSGRYIFLFGLGPAESYTGQVACQTFEVFLKKALELGVERVTIPFIPNPMTKTSLTHKATAYKLKQVVARVLSEHEGPVELKEIQIYCTPPAVRHIKHGLEIEHGKDDCHCHIE